MLQGAERAQGRELDHRASLVELVAGGRAAASHGCGTRVVPARLAGMAGGWVGEVRPASVLAGHEELAGPAYGGLGRGIEPRDQNPPPAVITLGVGMTMAEIERVAIQAALRETGGNRRKAAEQLGIGERTLYRKLREYEGEEGVDGGASLDET